MPNYTTIGQDLDSKVYQPIIIGDIERQSGLYILGKPGMGKTTLLQNLILEDIEHGHGVFFLDPHGDALKDICLRLPAKRKQEVIYLDPENKTHSFGINLLQCADVSSWSERNNTYIKAKGVFERIWPEDVYGLWIQLILSNTLYVFIEN